MNKVKLARQKMIFWHKGQKRRGGKPYHIHPIQVVKLLGKVDADIICAGYLHDVLEDTNATKQDLVKLFGVDITNLIIELTFPPNCADKQYWSQCKKLSDKAKLIKTADIIANINDEGVKSKHFIDKRIKALRIMWL